MMDKTLCPMRNYFGTVLKRNLNGEDIVIEENVLLQYDEDIDSYLWFDKGYKYLFDFINDVGRISNEENEINYQNYIKYLLKTDVPSVDGQLYIDKNSLVEVKNGKKSR